MKWPEYGLGYGFLLLLSCILFSVSIVLRAKYFGDIASGNSEASTGDILRWTRMWFEEGPASVHFGMPDLFKTIESPDLSSRGIYLSYPSGVVLFPYLISLLTGSYPNPSILMGVNLLGHFFAGVCAARMVQIFLIRNGCKEFLVNTSIMVALIVVYFSRGPFYFLQNVYVHDTAVILWISLLTLIELQVLIDLDHVNKYRIIYYLFSFIFSFLALFTDWSAYFVLFLLFLINLYFYYRSKKTEYLILALMKLAAVFISILSFLVIIFLSGYKDLLRRFFDRFGVGADIGVDKHISFDPRLLFDIGLTVFNLPIMFLVSFTFLFCLFYFFKVARKDRINFSYFENKYIYLLLPFSLLLGGIFYNLFFFNHTYFHLWSGIKFTIPIAFLMAISPWLILLALENIFKKRRPQLFLFLSCFPAVFLAGYTLKQSFETRGLFPPRDQFAIDYKQLDSVRKKLVFSDVVFSYEFSIGQKTLQSAYLSRPVYLVRGMGEIANKLSTIDGKANAILFCRPRKCPSTENNPVGKVVDRLGDYGDFQVVRLNLKSKEVGHNK